MDLILHIPSVGIKYREPTSFGANEEFQMFYGFLELHFKILQLEDALLDYFFLLWFEAGVSSPYMAFKLSEMNLELPICSLG